MAFEWNRIHKWEENLYNMADEMVQEYVFEYYGVNEIEELTEEQIEEVRTFYEGEMSEYSPLNPGFSSLIGWWESSVEEES